jgi:hypothetical protein
LDVNDPTEDKTDDVKGSFYEELECVFDKYDRKILLGDASMYGSWGEVPVVRNATEPNLLRVVPCFRRCPET